MRIREGTSDDFGLAVDSWCRTAEHAIRTPPKGITTGLWRRLLRRGFSGQLDEHGTELTVLELVPGHITSLAIWQPSDRDTLLHFVYTRRGDRDKSFRHRGFATLLLDHIRERHPGRFWATFTSPDGVRFLDAYQGQKHDAA